MLRGKHVTVQCGGRKKTFGVQQKKVERAVSAICKWADRRKGSTIIVLFFKGGHYGVVFSLASHEDREALRKLLSNRN